MLFSSTASAVTLTESFSYVSAVCCTCFPWSALLTSGVDSSAAGTDSNSPSVNNSSVPSPNVSLAEIVYALGTQDTINAKATINARIFLILSFFNLFIPFPLSYVCINVYYNFYYLIFVYIPLLKSFKFFNW